MKELSISHKLHPARQEGKSLAGVHVVKYVMAGKQSLMIGSNNVDALHDRIKMLYPEAKLTKRVGYLLVEKE